MEIEWLILADAAQVVGGKLYLLGGGWNRYTVNTGFPTPHSMAIAMSVLVPWNETNERRAFEIEIATDDGDTVSKAKGQFEVGRPAGIPAGSDQRAQMAVTINWEIKRDGTFVVIARVEGANERQFPFFVVPGPMLLAKRQPTTEDNAAKEST